MAWLDAALSLANQRLDDRHAAIGPSYFMRSDLDEAWIDRIWKHSLMPYIEERLVGQPDRLGEFRLDVLRAALAGDLTL
jgi:5-methylcytosine-specific restriction protein B